MTGFVWSNDVHLDDSATIAAYQVDGFAVDIYKSFQLFGELKLQHTLKGERLEECVPKVCVPSPHPNTWGLYRSEFSQRFTLGRGDGLEEVTKLKLRKNWCRRERIYALGGEGGPVNPPFGSAENQVNLDS